MPAHTNRRRLLQLAASAAATLWLPRSAWSQWRATSQPFSLGVASGTPSPDSVVLWTRIIGAPPQSIVTVQWEVAHDEAFTRIVQRGQHDARPELAHSVHVEAQGLDADRWYFYRFMAGGAVSPTGRTRTLPAADATVNGLRFAYASCQRWEHGYFSAWRHMREEGLDFVLFLGDYIYEYPTAARAVRAPTGGWLVSLDDYRARYALYRSDADLQAMHAACPWFMTWDDHEVQNDYAGLTAGDSGTYEPRVADFAARRASAYQAYYEHMPVRASALTRAVGGVLSGAEVRLYSQHRIGRLANLLILDDRQYRDPQVCNRSGRLGSSYFDPSSCAAWNDPSRTLLGRPQEAWLDGELAKQQAGWTLFGQQTLFGHQDQKKGPGEIIWNDGWDGYPAARRSLTDALQAHEVRDVAMFGGDMHENWVGHLKADYTRPDSATIGVEFCGTSITARADASPKTAEKLAENPHFVFADAERRGYGVAEITPKRITTTLRVVDDVTRQDTRIDTLARFAVDAGRPELQRLA